MLGTKISHVWRHSVGFWHCVFSKHLSQPFLPFLKGAPLQAPARVCFSCLCPGPTFGLHFPTSSPRLPCSPPKAQPSPPTIPQAYFSLHSGPPQQALPSPPHLSPGLRVCDLGGGGRKRGTDSKCLPRVHCKRIWQNLPRGPHCLHSPLHLPPKTFLFWVLATAGPSEGGWGWWITRSIFWSFPRERKRDRPHPLL